MQDHTLTVTAIDQLLFIHVEISCWSGKKTLTPEDLGLDRTQLPPETLVSLGDKQLINPEALRAFTSIRSAARRQCLAVGTRFMGGYAVPTVKAASLLNRLTALEASYQQAKTDFLATYDQQLAAWAAQQPIEWQKLIREALVPAAYVGSRLGFAIQVARFRVPEPDVVQHAGLTQALGGLSDQVFYEIAQEAKEALEKSFQGKTEVTRRALSPLTTLREKLEGLVFINRGFHTVIGEIHRLMARIPQKGPITGRVLEELVQFLALAAQPLGLKTWAAAAPVWTPPNGEWWPLADPASVSRLDDNVTASAQAAVIEPMGSAPCLEDDATASTQDADTRPIGWSTSERNAVRTPSLALAVWEPALTPEPVVATGDWFF